MIDYYGQRRSYILSVISFTIASFGCGMSVNQISLILFRALQGLSASILSPTTYSIINNCFTNREK